MIRNAKKNSYQLKFDTSKNNLQCFIKKKSMSIFQTDRMDKKRKNSKSKAKSLKKKLPDFHEQKFISSIIKNAMEEEFQDPKQVTQLLNKIHIQSEDKQQSPTNEDDLLKSFQIFKDSNLKLTPQIKNFPIISLDKTNHQKKEINKKIDPNSQEFSLGKQGQWNNFSTQIQSEVASERSKKQTIVETTSHLLNQQYYVPMKDPMMYKDISKQQYYSIENSHAFFSLSKQQKHRKSTPIRQNEEFRINLDKVENDGRTTVMIRHIPNKYTQQMLIDEINVNHKLKYNFFYLPLDSYNPCNVGYAFINFIDTKFISKFYLEFNGKRWNKFNSEKICQLAYARIQGSKALINHFQNSNVMHCRDRRYRPFISYGDNFRT